MVLPSAMGSTLMMFKVTPVRNLCSHLQGRPGGVSMQGRDNEVSPQAGARPPGAQQMVSVVKFCLVLSSRRSEARSQGAQLRAAMSRCRTRV